MSSKAATGLVLRTQRENIQEQFKSDVGLRSLDYLTALCKLSTAEKCSV